jgi:hypothetical protein
MGRPEGPGGSTARVGPILRCSQVGFALGGPGAESLRPAQARDPIPSVSGGGGSVCKRIWPGRVVDSLSGRAGGKKGPDSNGTRITQAIGLKLLAFRRILIDNINIICW